MCIRDRANSRKEARQLVTHAHFTLNGKKVDIPSLTVKAVSYTHLDFRGINPNAFDGRGNYALGIKEQLIFPEIEYDKVDKVRGMDIRCV